MTGTDGSPLEPAQAVSSEEFARDPFPMDALLRQTPGWLALSGYRVVSSHDDVQQILRHPW
jgi:hypothetical protein